MAFFYIICLTMVALFTIIRSVETFVTPTKSFVSSRSSSLALSPSSSYETRHLQQQYHHHQHRHHSLAMMMPPSSVSSDILVTSSPNFDGFGASSSFLMSNALMEGLQTFAIAATAIIFLFAALTYITASFIIPQAAKQLEEETKKLRPDLWDEYTARLEPGETIATRPDLLQELGTIMQPIIQADFEERMKEERDLAGGGTSIQVRNNNNNERQQQQQQSSGSGTIMDAEVLDKKTQEDQK